MALPEDDALARVGIAVIAHGDWRPGPAGGEEAVGICRGAHLPHLDFQAGSAGILVALDGDLLEAVSEEGLRLPVDQVEEMVVGV